MQQQLLLVRQREIKIDSRIRHMQLNYANIFINKLSFISQRSIGEAATQVNIIWLRGTTENADFNAKLLLHYDRLRMPRIFRVAAFVNISHGKMISTICNTFDVRRDLHPNIGNNDK